MTDIEPIPEEPSPIEQIEEEAIEGGGKGNEPEKVVLGFES